MIRLALNWLKVFIDPRLVLGIMGLPRYFSDWQRYNRLTKPEEALQWQESRPFLTDWTSYTPFDPHYFYQAAWIARKLREYAPAHHIDVGSSVMVAGMISATATTTFVDYRPFQAHITGLNSLAGDLLSLPFEDNTVLSLSCLHVIEHVGLGRYGDKLNPQGSLKAGQELSRILAPGGRLFLSTPVGRERIQFNAHRVFAPETILRIFSDLELLNYAMVDDQGKFHEQVHPTQNRLPACEYACGMFEFVKR